MRRMLGILFWVCILLIFAAIDFYYTKCNLKDWLAGATWFHIAAVLLVGMIICEVLGR